MKLPPAGTGAGGNKPAFSPNTTVWAYSENEGIWRKAVIISTDRRASVVNSVRLNKHGTSASSLTLKSCGSNASLCDPGPAEPEAYVHWKGYDRRMDCWVRVSQIRPYPSTPLSELVGGYSLAEGEASDDAHAGMDQDYIREHVESTKFKTIEKIKLGSNVVDCWYFSPYPVEVQNCDCLFICEFCLSFFADEWEFDQHNRRCTARHPPGNEIYRDMSRKLSVWEVDGGFSRIYCENLCFLSKLFLDHKTLRHPVRLFLFYILAEHRVDGYHVVGYFSKEKYSRNNVSCIMVLPQYQKHGYGKYLINFSYALSLKEGRRGTPERPLSDLGHVSYLRYWRQHTLEFLEKNRLSAASVEDIAAHGAFEPDDVVTTLQERKMLVQEPNTKTVFFHLTNDFKQILVAKLGLPPSEVLPHELRWLPYDPFLGPYEFSGI